MNILSGEQKTLAEKYPPSQPCSCEICVNFCIRPGWWTVEQAFKVINAGMAHRMMLEISPELNFGVLSPAFKGCEGKFALNEYSQNRCNFLVNNLCELHSIELMPLECRFCHHERLGLGQHCHDDIEKDWNTQLGKALIAKWIKITGLWINL